MSSYLGSVGSNGDRVTRAIATSARRTGVDFTYLMGQARIESGMNPDAKASTSSATGLYQFINQSWLGVVDKHGSKHGLDWAANAIQRDGKGRYRVADPETRQAILALRKNPEVAALMAGEFASDNRQYLEGSLGRQAAPRWEWPRGVVAGRPKRVLLWAAGWPVRFAGAAKPAAQSAGAKVGCRLVGRSNAIRW